MNAKMDIRFFLISVSLLLCGCEQAVQMDFAPVDIISTDVRIDAEMKHINIVFGKEEERLGGIQKGLEVKKAEFKSLFEDSLYEALTRSSIFTDVAKQKLLLVAKVLRMETPSVDEHWGCVLIMCFPVLMTETPANINFTTKFTVRYQLLDISTDKLVFTKVIDSQSSVPEDYAVSNMERYLEARNIAVRENVLLFISSLAEFKQ